MSIPICPLLMQARASIPRLVVGWEDFRDGEKPASVTDGPLYPDPSQAPGVACIGSRCAAWRSAPDDVAMRDGQKVYTPTHRGRCGYANGDEHRDPAQGVSHG